MKKILFSIFLFFSVLSLHSQKDSIFKLTQLQNDKDVDYLSTGIKLNHFWKYHKGDSIKWANPAINDSKWKYIQTELDLLKIPVGTFENCGWFRLHIEVDTQFVNKPLLLMLSQQGASEIYLDGKLLHKFGKIDPHNILMDEPFNPHYFPINITFESKRNHLIAVRYRNKNAQIDFQNNLVSSSGFNLNISDLETVFDFTISKNFYYKGSIIFYFTFFLALAILHFLLYMFYKKNKSNLYYSLFAFSFGIILLISLITNALNKPDDINSIIHLTSYLRVFYISSLLAMLYSIFYNKILKIFWFWLLIMIAELIGKELKFETDITSFIILIEPIRIVIVSIYKKKDGAWIIGSGVITTILSIVTWVIISVTGKTQVLFNQNTYLSFFILLLTYLSTISIPLSMSAFLALGFAKTNKNLEKKLLEVEDLNIKSIEQEKEKQQILADQNTNLEKQVKLRTHEVVEQKKIIEEKNKDITDSISYAKRIQDATLSSKELKYKLFPEAFVLFKPKDIVSGDFYWFAEINGIKFIAAADCTGHGVPGAMVSVVCSNALNRAIKEFGLFEPGKILDKVRELVLESFSTQHNTSNDEGVKDGMDISLMSIPHSDNANKVIINWAGANNPLWYIQNNILIEIKANKQPIGKTDNPLPFTNHVLELNKNDTIYLFSDGYADQFGGPKGKKFKYKQLSDLLLSINHISMMEQETILEKSFNDWKNDLEQIDDVLFIGVKL